MTIHPCHPSISPRALPSAIGAANRRFPRALHGRPAAASAIFPCGRLGNRRWGRGERETSELKPAGGATDASKVYCRCREGRTWQGPAERLRRVTQKGRRDRLGGILRKKRERRAARRGSSHFAIFLCLSFPLSLHTGKGRRGQRKRKGKEEREREVFYPDASLPGLLGPGREQRSPQSAR